MKREALQQLDLRNVYPALAMLADAAKQLELEGEADDDGDGDTGQPVHGQKSVAA